MAELDVAILGASKLSEDGAPMWQAVVPITDDTNDVEPLGEAVVMQALGLYSQPWQKDANGYAEAVFARNCGGRDAICLGARDTRTAAITGNLQPGDTVLCSTGPKQAAQVRCSESKRQVTLATKDTRGRTMAFVLDGRNDKVQVAALGAMIEIDDRGDISIINSNGAGLLIQGGKIHVLGELSLQGMQPGLAIMQGPAIGDPSGTAPLLPVLGVSK